MEKHKSGTDLVAAAQYKGRSPELISWTDTRESKSSMVMSWKPNGETTSKLVHRIPKIIQKFWTCLPNFNKLGRDVQDMAKHCTEMTTPGVPPIIAAPYHAAPKARKLQEDGNQRNAAHERYRICTVRVGITDQICTEREHIARTLYRLQKAECCDCQEHPPNQRMDEYLDSLGEVHIFRTLNASYGYWQIKIDDPDKDKTTFTSHHGQYRFL